MKRMGMALAVVLTAGCLLAWVATPARGADELCPMGGVMVKIPIDKGKALEWARGLRQVAVDGADTDAWSVLTLSRTSGDIALLVTPGYVFFGVAGRGGEVYPRDIEKAFGRDMKKLREAVRREVGDLDKAGVLRVSGNEIQQLADNAGLGVLEKTGSTWGLTTRDCQAVDLPASGL